MPMSPSLSPPLETDAPIASPLSGQLFPDAMFLIYDLTMR